MAKKKPKIDRDWIVAQLSRGIDAEHALEADALATAKSPPDPSLAVLYHQIAREDQQHASVLETIATRYGYQGGSSAGGGLSGTLGRIAGAMTQLGASPLERLEHDLTAKASSIHWAHAWVFAFQAIGDATSAADLSTLIQEETAHHAALQQGLNLLLARGAQGTHA